MAAVDYFLKIDGVDGESEDKSYPKSLQIESFSFGGTNSGSSGYGTGAGTGKVNMQDFHFVVAHSKASAILFLKMCAGDHIGKAVLTCRKSTGSDGGQLPYLTVEFGDIVISSFQTGGSAGSPIPTEQISFNYTKIVWESKAQDKDGKISSGPKHGWDTKKNQKV
jgi:type VI secretion system secreted protein Hcp